MAIQLPTKLPDRTVPPRPIHQQTLAALHIHFWQYVTQQKLGKILFSPLDVNLPGLASPVQPDLIFISNDNLDIMKEKTIEGVPELIIEVLSPGNPAHDRHTKFKIYARAGVREYWIVDPDAGTIDVFVLRGQAYASLATFGPDETVRSELFADFTVPVNEICSG